MPPSARPIPRFIAESPRELEPYGRWRHALEERFFAACEQLDDFASLGEPGDVEWFPERTVGGRTYVPAAAPTANGYELFGFVSFVRPAEDEAGDPADFRVRVDFTGETAAENPDWKLDLNEEVIAPWRGPGGATGDLTLVWGAPLVPGGVAATAELGDETVDQCALVQSDRFTLVALDALHGMGDDLYLEVKLWNRAGDLLATESLYAEPEEAEEAEEG
jgi:hypothetical protein